MTTCASAWPAVLRDQRRPDPGREGSQQPVDCDPVTVVLRFPFAKPCKGAKDVLEDIVWCQS